MGKIPYISPGSPSSPLCSTYWAVICLSAEFQRSSPPHANYHEALWTLPLRFKYSHNAFLLFFFFKPKFHHFYKSTTFSCLLPLYSCLLLHPSHFSSTTSTSVLHCKKDDKRPEHQHASAFIPSFAHSLSASQDYLGCE